MQISTPHPRRWPTDEEIKQCWSVAEGLDAEINKIKRTILSLQDQVEALEKEKKTNYLSFVSPIRCLSSELIIKICLACVEAGVSPQILNQICGRFSEIVNSTVWIEMWNARRH
ncbi:hypothetical protein CPB86DRAFT_366257 [Serendipita vermifera]|nr:hypothetical protein CPB86DRAFT_366257 [Serendipita vermifera]